MISFVLGAASYKHKKYLTSFKINLFNEDSSYKIKKAINKVDFISNNNFQLLNYFIPESESIVNTMYLSLLIQKYDLNLITGEDNKSKGAICVFENKLIIEGTHKEWKKRKSLENRISKMKDDLQGIKEFYDQKSVTHLNAINPELGAIDREEYSVENPEEWDAKIDEAVKFFETNIEKLETELGELNEVD